MLIYNMMRE
jgi:hypothetical protein